MEKQTLYLIVIIILIINTIRLEIEIERFKKVFSLAELLLDKIRENNKNYGEEK